MVFPTRGVILQRPGLSTDTWELCRVRRCLAGRLSRRSQAAQKRGRAGPRGPCAGSPGEPTAELGSRPRAPWVGGWLCRLSASGAL